MDCPSKWNVSVIRSWGINKTSWREEGMMLLRRSPWCSAWNKHSFYLFFFQARVCSVKVIIRFMWDKRGFGKRIFLNLCIENTAYGSLKKRHFAFSYSGFLLIVTFINPSEVIITIQLANFIFVWWKDPVSLNIRQLLEGCSSPFLSDMSLLDRIRFDL